MRPKDRIPAWPEQAACMRMQRCMDLLSQILPDAQYTALRTTVAQWDIASEPESAKSIAKREDWARRKAG